MDGKDSGRNVYYRDRHYNMDECFGRLNDRTRGQTNVTTGRLAPGLVPGSEQELDISRPEVPCRGKELEAGRSWSELCGTSTTGLGPEQTTTGQWLI